MSDIGSKLVVVSGPAGVGKDTVVAKLQILITLIQRFIGIHGIGIRTIFQVNIMIL